MIKAVTPMANISAMSLHKIVMNMCLVDLYSERIRYSNEKINIITAILKKHTPILNDSENMNEIRDNSQILIFLITFAFTI